MSNRNQTNTPNTDTKNDAVDPAIITAKNDAPPAKEPDAPKKKKIEVDEDVLTGILAEIRELKTKTSEFEKTAPQDQIRKIESMRAQGKLVKAVKIRRYDGELVRAWKMIKDDVWVADGKINEIQILKVITEGGEREVSLVQFTRGCSYETYEVVREAKDADGELELTVLLKDGKPFVINDKYIN